MKVSTIIRTYNRGYVVGKALRSALDQTYADLEVIIVDDGSTDETLHVVRSFPSERVRYVRHEQNRGVAAACNTGIAAARGELIAVLDSDDVWKPDKLERQVGFLARHSEAAAVFSDVEIVNGQRRIPSLMTFMHYFPRLLEVNGNAPECVLEQRAMYLCLLQEVPIKPSAVLLRREVFEKVGMFDEASQSGEDWDFFLRLSHIARFGYITAPLVIQHWLHDAAHRKHWEEDKVFLLERFLREKKELRRDREALAAVRLGISSHCSNLAYHYLFSERRKRSIAVYLQGFRETWEVGFLLRAASALMPLRLRDSLGGAVSAALLSRGSRRRDTGAQS